MRILIIDDNPADVDMIKEIFSDIDGINYQATVIENGNDAIKFLNREPPYEKVRNPNLIILDLNLPGRTGHEILREMRRLGNTTPVIVYTTSDRPEDIAKTYRLHANCYVVKPSEFNQINHVLRLLGQFWMQAATLPEEGM